MIFRRERPRYFPGKWSILRHHTHILTHRLQHTIIIRHHQSTNLHLDPIIITPIFIILVTITIEIITTDITHGINHLYLIGAIVMALDINKLRQDLSAFTEKPDYQPFIYFDNTSVTLTPKPVIDSIVEYYSTPGNLRSADEFSVNTMMKCIFHY